MGPSMRREAEEREESVSPPEEEVVHLAAPRDAQEPVGATPVPGATWERTLLAVRGPTTFYLALDDRPWTRDVDLLVVPSSDAPFGLPGGLALAIDRSADDVGGRRQAAIEEALRKEERSVITPEKPLPFGFPKGYGLPPWGALATSVGEQGPRVELAGRAAVACVELAARRGLRRVAIPLIGAGMGKLPPTEVMAALVRALLARPGFPGVREVTLVTRNEEALAAGERVLAGRAQRLANDLVGGDDLLDVDAEISALAETLLLRDVEPPLVAGIFGGWGSGKSFAMHLMQRRMSELRALPVPAAEAWPEPGAEAFPWVGHVYVVRFDAWTYAKSNLWASLMQTIFRDLDHQLGLEAELSGGDADRALRGGAAHGDLVLESATERTPAAPPGGDRLWKELQKQRAAEHEALAGLEQRLAAQRTALAQARTALDVEVEEEIEAGSREEAWKALEGALKERAEAVLDALRDGLAPGLREKAGPAQEAILAVRGLLSIDWREALAIVALTVAGVALVWGAALATGLIQWATNWVDAELPRLLGSGAVGGIAGLVTGLFRAGRRWQEKLAESRAAFERHLELERSRRRAQKEQRREEKLAKQRAVGAEGAQKNVPALERAVEELASQVERQRQRVGVTASYVSLSHFVSSRLEEGVYEKELGLIHQVQRDLLDLTEGLAVHPRDPEPARAAKRALFPRGPARVVLFIDDLDRCPPAKVVEVLEAAQLLVKTRLFVVVLAMDERFITRALEKVYAGVLERHGDPSGLDYIEKIVQIPYRVRRIHGEAVTRYLAAQMRVAAPSGAPDAPTPTGGPPPSAPPPSTASAPPPSAAGPSAAGPSGSGPGVAPPAPTTGVLPREAVEFSADELEDLAAACNQVGLTPRAIKRLVNVYKLLKIIWYRPNGFPAPERDERQVLVTLLALTARLPVSMQRILDELAPAVDDAGASLPGLLVEKAGALRAELDRHDLEIIERAARALSARPPEARGSVSRPSFGLLQSFCFVGDIGREAEGRESPS